MKTPRYFKGTPSGTPLQVWLCSGDKKEYIIIISLEQNRWFWRNFCFPIMFNIESSLKQSLLLLIYGIWKRLIFQSYSNLYIFASPGIWYTSDDWTQGKNKAAAAYTKYVKTVYTPTTTLKKEMKRNERRRKYTKQQQAAHFNNIMCLQLLFYFCLFMFFMFLIMIVCVFVYPYIHSNSR